MGGNCDAVSSARVETLAVHSWGGSSSIAEEVACSPTSLTTQAA
jgi:hypothetical protein